MKVIARPVGTGKTKELLNMAAAADGTVLTCNKRGLQAKANAYHYKNNNPAIVDLADLIYGNYDDTKPLFVHKLDDVMEEYFKSDFRLKLEGYSIALEEEATPPMAKTIHNRTFYHCGVCNGDLCTLVRRDKYCAECGRKVDWTGIPDESWDTFHKEEES